MGDSTGIQWTDATWNPLRARHRETGAEGWACVRVSDGCKHCYAATLNESRRWNRGTGLDYTVPALAQVEPYLDEATLTQPLRWRKPRRIFVCSMTDLFGEWVTDAEIDRVFGVMAATPQHTYQVLTKRPERMREYVARAPKDDSERFAVIDNSSGAHFRVDRWSAEFEKVRALNPREHPEEWDPREWPLPNVWLGTSVEDQERADGRIPLLLDTPAAIRFLSCEPLLGPVDLERIPTLRGRELGALSGIEYSMETTEVIREWPTVDWVIVGGESGPGARPFDLAWARSLVRQCQDAGVPVFVKQLGSRPGEQVHAAGWCDESQKFSCTGFHGPRLKHNHGGNPGEWPEDLRVREWPAGAPVTS
jgi:protein gp37